MDIRFDHVGCVVLIRWSIWSRLIMCDTTAYYCGENVMACFQDIDSQDELCNTA
jgi:hypothetical protein